jgi:hypothetical protein
MHILVEKDIKISIALMQSQGGSQVNYKDEPFTSTGIEVVILSLRYGVHP